MSSAAGDNSVNQVSASAQASTSQVDPRVPPSPSHSNSSGNSTSSASESQVSPSNMPSPNTAPESESKDSPSKSSPKKGFVSKYVNMKPKVINKISTLHDHAHPTAMFVFDIDETLVMSPHRGRLFTPEGMAAFENQLATMPLAESQKQVIIERMQELLDQKVLVEREHSASVVRHLQQLGCWVFGLTSRYCSTAVRTHHMLASLDIDFSQSSPLPSDVSLQDPGTGAVYSRGVIYTNAMDKGFVLNRFLENVLLRDLWDAAAAESRNRVVKEGEEFTLTNEKFRVPSQIVFIDDRVSNSESVLQGLSMAEKFNIPVYSYHYTGATEDEDLVSATELSLCIDKTARTKHGGCIGDSIEDIVDLLFPVEDGKSEDKMKVLATLKKVDKLDEEQVVQLTSADEEEQDEFGFKSIPDFNASGILLSSAAEML